MYLSNFSTLYRMPKYQFLFQDAIPAGPGKRKQKGRARNSELKKLLLLKPRLHTPYCDHSRNFSSRMAESHAGLCHRNSCETPPFLKCYHRINCSVQCSIGTNLND